MKKDRGAFNAFGSGATLLLGGGALVCCVSGAASLPAPTRLADAGKDAPGREDDGGPPDDGDKPGKPGKPDQDGDKLKLKCPSTGKAVTAGTVASAEVNEASGIVVSAVNDGSYWVHNDSGDTARAFAVGKDGALLATLSFDSLNPHDIEDMAIEDESPGKSFLYFGDIGDNAATRPDLTIHRVAEPKLTGVAALTATSEKMTVTYADGPHNAETLLFDPITKDLLIATKKLGGLSAIHRIGPFSAGKSVKTTQIATVAVDMATGGEISRDGRLIAIRNYGKSAFVWVRAPGESVTDALARKPCTLPIGGFEIQGEAFAFLLANEGYATISEGASPALHVTPFK